MLAFLGDIHGEVHLLTRALDEIKENYPSVVALIQVGDFGIYPSILPKFQRIDSHIPIYVIDGNHEHHTMVMHYTKPTEIAPNIIFVPRGTVMELDGRTIGFLGGAASIDKNLRLRYGNHWSQFEEVTKQDIEKFDGVESVDILVTHTPPQNVIDLNFPKFDHRAWSIPANWHDPSARYVQALWERLNKPTLLCGHMHASIVHGSCRILDIGEVIAM